MIKKTKYFSSSFVAVKDISNAINDVETKRDQYIDQNKGSISEIDSESIQFVFRGTEWIAAIISLTFFQSK